MSANNEDWLPPKLASSPLSIGDGWKSRLICNKYGIPKPGVSNALIALRTAPEWQGVLHFNESRMVTVVKQPPPFAKAPAVPFAWVEEHDVLTAAWLQHQGIFANKEIASQAVHAVSKEHPFHPVRDYLDGLTWDGTKRIDGWLTPYLGVDPLDYSRAVGTKFLIGGVARIYQPGVKLDTCPILEGPQGARKSTALRTLASAEFFTDDISELGSKDSVMQTRGVWIIELSELDALSRGDLAQVKAFMSRQVDRIRPPYGRRVIDAPRECIFAGTVNKETYLKDETGGRRFWPIKCGAIDIAALERDRDQIWAEARDRYRAGEKWWFEDQTLIAAAAEQVAARYEADPWDTLIEEWLSDPQPRIDQNGPVAGLVSSADFVTTKDILIHCIGKRSDSWQPADQTRVARYLVAKGWTRTQRRLACGRVWGYVLSPLVTT